MTCAGAGGVRGRSSSSARCSTLLSASSPASGIPVAHTPGAASDACRCRGCRSSLSRAAVYARGSRGCQRPGGAVRWRAQCTTGEVDTELPVQSVDNPRARALFDRRACAQHVRGVSRSRLLKVRAAEPVDGPAARAWRRWWQTRRSATGPAVRSCGPAMVGATGIEPVNLCDVNAALYQLSYAPSRRRPEGWR